MHVSAYPFVLLAVFTVYKIVAYFVEERKHAARARQLGCKEPPAVPDGGFLGLNLLKKMQEADKSMTFPDMLLWRQNQMNELHGRQVTVFTNTILGQKQYFTNEPENIKAMLATQFADFDLGEARRGNMITTLGDGIFVQDGKHWEHSRSMLRPNFVRDQISDLELEERHLQDLLNVMPVQADGWTAETNIQPLFFRLTIDSATEFLFGRSVDSQLLEADINGSPHQDKNSFSTNFDSAQMHLARRFRFGNNYWLHNPKEFRENNKVVKAFVRRIVDKALKETEADSKTDLEKGEKYVFLNELTKQTRDPEELSAQLLNILLAGRDTTASLLAWLFHQLLRHPEVFDKLRNNIVETFGTFDDPQEISFATLKSCQYLQHCLNETLRLYTVVPGNARRTNKATTLPTGGGPDGKSPIYIRPQTEVGYSVHVMMRRKDLWGEDADQFRPDRFIGRRSGWEFLPFNGGPRICIGQQFALTEASYVVVRLLQKFDKIEATPEELAGPTTYFLTLTSCPGRPVKLRMREARND